MTTKSLFTVLLIFPLACTTNTNKSDDKEKKSSSGMVWIPGGEFLMGTDDTQAYEHERPAHKVKVNGFWMDETEVTNAQFQEFVKAAGYVTIAERTPEWTELRKQLPPETPKPADSLLVPGALVFTRPPQAVTLNDYSLWWKWVPGASWKHPSGPHTNIEGRLNHPVVQIAYEDAVAYCAWSDKRLPTEAEWEFASRGGKDQQRYAWGTEVSPNGKMMANTFQGSFPVADLKEDGFDSTAPVKSFPSNTYGLYDIIGNVWEWTSDWYDVQYFSMLAEAAISVDPKGPAKSYDPNDPYAMKRVTKGGSYLCASNYCVNYRPSARQATAFDSGASNLGFRCVRDVKP
jgi:formylglycine-generating enzyme